MEAASDGRGQLPLGALAAAVQDEVCAGPGGHGRLRLGALGLGLLLLPQGAPGALWLRPLVAALLHKTDAVAPIGVLAEALP